MANIDIGVARYVHKNPGRLKKVKNELLQYLDVNPDDCNYLFVLGHLYYVEGDFPAAEKCFGKCAALDSGERKYQIAQAFAYRQMGLYDKSDDVLFEKKRLND